MNTTQQTSTAPESKQGGDAIKVDTNAIVLLQTRISSPRPSAVKDPVASEQLRNIKGDAFDAVTDMLRDENKRVYPELKKVTAIRNRWNTFLDKYALKFSMGGMRVISVHHMDIVKDKIVEINDELRKQADVIKNKLPEWEKTAQKKGNYVEGKFPKPEYFSGYGVSELWLDFNPNFDISACLDEIKDNAIDKIREDIESCLNALTSYLSDEKGSMKSFHESNVTQLCETAERLKDSGILSSDSFESFCERVMEAGKKVNVSAIREAKKKIDKGVSRKTSQQEIDDCKKIVETATDPFKELSEELEGLV